MPAVTGTREIDRKLHRIIREADPSEYPTAIALGRALEKAKPNEFAYQRGQKTEYATAVTIADYVLYAREIGLLDGNLEVTRARGDVRSLDNFQQWLSDVVFRYLRDNNASLEHIESAVETLLSTNPRQLPTLDNLYKNLNSPPPKDYLRLSLKIVSLLRPKALQLKSRRLVLVPKVVTA